MFLYSIEIKDLELENSQVRKEQRMFRIWHWPITTGACRLIEPHISMLVVEMWVPFVCVGHVISSSQLVADYDLDSCHQKAKFHEETGNPFFLWEKLEN